MSCQPTRYPDKMTAKRAAHFGPNHLGTVKQYYCPECGFWHNTKRRKRTRRKR